MLEMNLQKWSEPLPKELENLAVGPSDQRRVTVLLREPMVNIACKAAELRPISTRRMSQLLCNLLLLLSLADEIDGPSGSGKSTTLFVLAWMLRELGCLVFYVSRGMCRVGRCAQHCPRKSFHGRVCHAGGNCMCGSSRSRQREP